MLDLCDRNTDAHVAATVNLACLRTWNVCGLRCRVPCVELNIGYCQLLLRVDILCGLGGALLEEESRVSKEVVPFGLSYFQMKVFDVGRRMHYSLEISHSSF